MTARLRQIAFVIAALLLAVPGARAEALRKVVDELVEAPAPDVAVEQANDAALARFESLLAVYDRQIEQHPSDVVARMNRCRFMVDFALNYEVAEFADEIRERGDECMTQFEQSYPEHPETLLQELQSAFGDDVLERGEAVVADAQSRGTWTAGQLGRLYTLLARTADGNGDSEQALNYALLALQTDEESDVRLIAATQLIAHGNKVRALEILRAPIDSLDEDRNNGWELSRKMRLLSKAGAPQDAIALYPRLREMSFYSHSEAAELLLAAGASDLARQELEIAVKNGKYSTQEEGARFRLELQYGTAEAAFDAYQAWRDLGWTVDPLGINRAALLTRDASLPWRARDITGALGLVAASALLALLAGLPIAAVHYRGLVVRARSNQPYPRSDWTLRQGWLALSAFFIASVLALYFAGALDLGLNDDTLWEFEPGPEQLSRIGLAGALLGIALMLPFAAGARRHEGAWWSTHWSIGKCLLVGAAIAVALRIPVLLAWAAKPDAIPSIAADDVLWQMLRSVQERYGLFVALWILSVAAPVTEEFVFRGVLYRAFSAHLRPLWANLLQATLFSAMHLEDVKGTILLFVLGLTLGTLTRRSGGLLAAMTLHAAFNLIAGLIILRGS